jgi:branched-chain amino acid transport system ATP-binding protein
MVGSFHGTKDPETARKDALEILEFLELADLSAVKAGSLTISDRKHLEIARALATKPRLLLLDEPMGGMNSAEMDQMMEQIQKVQEDGITIFIIEHVMKAIMAISHRVVVLHHGKKIAEGIPQEVSRTAEVINAYLGEEYVES